MDGVYFQAVLRMIGLRREGVGVGGEGFVTESFMVSALHRITGMIKS
jgi:hypothetical protein